MFEEIIREREQQLAEAIQLRTALKQQIENYREEIDQYSKTMKQIERTVISIPRKSILRSSASQEFQIENNQEEHPASFSSHPTQLAITQTKETSVEEGTLVRFTDFDVKRG
jgi:uncharacterized protein